MRIENSFTIPASPDETYRLLIDLPRVAPCIPGGELGPRADDDSHPAKVTVKVGPMRLVYQGTLRIAEQDDAARRAVLLANAREVRGQGAAQAEMTMHVGGDGAASAKVTIITELQLTGRAAQMGRGIVGDVARRLVDEMAVCLERRFGSVSQPTGAAEPTGTPQKPTEPVRGLSLGVQVLAGRIKQLLGRLKGERNAGA
jgi:carbon monoxide dehydrogenase subunit G